MENKLKIKEFEQQPELKQVSTKALIDELQGREGVKKIIADPYQMETISTEGPAIILEIID